VGSLRNVPREGVVREGVTIRAKDKLGPDLELVKELVIREGYKA